MLFHRAAVDLSPRTLDYVAGLIRRHRKAAGTVWRRLNPGRQALLVLVHLRKGETFREFGAGFGVSVTTAWRYVREAVALLSARSPELGQALRRAERDGLRYLVLDGTPIRTDRVKADRPFYSGKHRAHGMNVQVIASPEGAVLWTSGALPGSVHDLTAARAWGVLRRLEQAGMLVLADKAYQGAGGPVVTPCKGKKGRKKPESQKRANRSHARLRGPGERANAQLRSWRILRKLRCGPEKAGHLCKAIAVLQNQRLARG
ncbi:Helix-turn-helix of DDE superfamily endonuclease [Sinosporangium album]|uniref:Helix-turn-helix of DDE superfamily endonuclease n=1 Tax=Sinosporangium album TaxID=504805 RepID=A0A1G8LCH7_9ACTN|nr:transposase family protein [Sinosporangium album]SDI53355.1 Helix-turn-helix of DDE superfamily endonuclease [Sinosporangium album]